MSSVYCQLDIVFSTTTKKHTHTKKIYMRKKKLRFHRTQYKMIITFPNCSVDQLTPLRLPIDVHSESTHEPHLMQMFVAQGECGLSYFNQFTPSRKKVHIFFHTKYYVLTSFSDFDMLIT